MGFQSLKLTGKTNIYYSVNNTINVINRSILSATDKIKSLACLAFEQMKQIAYNCLDLVWPYKAIPIDTLKEKEVEDQFNESALSSWVAQTIYKGSELALNPPPEEKKKLSITALPVSISDEITTVFQGAMIAAPVYVASQWTLHGTNGNFLQTQAALNFTAMVLQFTAFPLFNGCLNLKTLHDKGMFRKGDPIDQFAYTSGLMLTATAINMLTGGVFQKPLHVISTVIGNVPPIESAIMKLPLSRKISAIAHSMVNVGEKLLDEAKEIAKKPIKFFIKPYIVKMIRNKMIPKIDTFAKENEENLKVTVSDHFKNNFDVELPEFLSTRIGSLVSTLVEHHITEPAQKTAEQSIATTINKTTDLVADLFVGIQIKAIKMAVTEAIRYKFLSTTLTLTSTSLPLLGVATLIVNGGPQQSLGELSLRVAGATIFLFTGSTFLPLALVHAPYLIHYFITLRGRHIRKQGLLHDPIVDIFKRNFSRFFPGHFVEELEELKKLPEEAVKADMKLLEERKKAEVIEAKKKEILNKKQQIGLAAFLHFVGTKSYETTAFAQKDTVQPLYHKLNALKTEEEFLADPAAEFHGCGQFEY